MASAPTQRFERDMACAESDWLSRLPAAVHGHVCELLPGQQTARVLLGVGCLRLRWRVLPPRRIASLCLPRLWVGFEFDGVAAPEREAFMRRFDLHLQRGGG